MTTTKSSSTPGSESAVALSPAHVALIKLLAAQAVRAHLAGVPVKDGGQQRDTT